MRFIVAEVSKNWVRGQPVVENTFLSRQFEDVINRNYERGYQLHSFTLHRLGNGYDEMNETIIAVFERREA